MSRSSSVRSTNSCCLSTRLVRRLAVSPSLRGRPGRVGRRTPRRAGSARCADGAMRRRPTLSARSRVPRSARRRSASTRLGRGSAAARARPGQPDRRRPRRQRRHRPGRADGRRRRRPPRWLLPEMFLTGYPIEDLALRPSFVEASRAAVDRAGRARSRAEGLGELAVVVGYLDRRRGRRPTSSGRPRGAPQNARRRAARRRRRRALRQAPPAQLRRLRRVPLLRARHRHAASSASHGVDVALAICEDLWQDGGPVADARRARAPGCCSCSTARRTSANKDDVRLALVRRRAAEAGCTLAYVNMVGGQDELVFDGDSLVVAADGEVLARADAVRRGACSSSTSTCPAADPLGAASTR